MSDYINNLSEAVAVLHGCRCSHVGTAHVHEMMDGKDVWKGDVEIYSLTGHQRAAKAFAWSYEDNAGETHYMAVLALGPIVSPREAVQAAIASGKQR